MLTPDEVRAVPLFANLSGADLDRLVRTSADIRLDPGEYAVHEGDERALFAVLAGRIEAVKRHRRRRARGRRASAGDDLRRGADRPRHAASRRLPGGRAVARHAHRAARLPRDRRRRRPRSPTRSGPLARERIGGLQGLASSAPHRRDHASSGTAGTPPAATCGASSTATRSVPTGSRPTRRMPRSSWAGAAGRGDLPGRSASSTARRWCGRSCASVAELLGLADARRGRGVRHRDRRRRPGRAGRRRVRRVRGPAHASSSSARRPAVRPARRRGSRTTSASRPACRATSWPAARCSRRAGSARRSSSRARSTRHRPGDAPGPPRRRRRAARGAIILACRRRLAAARDRRLRAARRQGHLLRRRPQRGVEHARPRRPHHRRRQLGRPGGAVLLQPRAQRHDPLPRRRPSSKSMSRYLVDQLGDASRTSTCATGREVIAAHGDASLEAIDVRDSDTGETTRHESRRPVHLHRRRRRDRLAAAGDRARPEAATC